LLANKSHKIMHIALPPGKYSVLMGSDAGRHRDAKNIVGNNISISVSAESKERADKVFGKLSENGAVAMPIQEMFWDEYFGMCTDQFGINWMISYGESSES